jgi:osmoprotectant transport system permease protein
VLLAGSVLGLCALGLDFLIFRPNRLAPGQELFLFQALPAGYSLGVCALWAYFLLRSFARPGRLLHVDRITAALAPPGLLLALGGAASALLAGSQPYARVSMGAGVWTALFAIFIILVDRYRPGGTGWAKLLPAGTGAALTLWILASGHMNDLSVVTELLHRQQRFLTELSNHLWITGLSVSLSTLAGIPLGLAVYRTAWLRAKTFFLLNIVQTIPSLALFGLLIAPLALLSRTVPLLREMGFGGIGTAPAVIALTLYALLPVVRNTYAGFSGVEAELIEAGRGMGMSRTQLLLRVELPRALPVMIGGLRVACVQNVGNTAVAALIGAGGFGVFIFQGLGQAALDLIMLGALPTILLAVGVDGGFQALIRISTPRGLR